MNKDDLIRYLEETINNIEIDYHNEYTQEWSQGFRKGSLFILEKIKRWDE